MTISLITQNLIDDIGAKFLMETNGTDPIPPKGVTIQRLNESCADLIQICGRFIEDDWQDIASDSLHKDDAIVFNLIMSRRRSAGKTQAIADLMHAYLVNAALSKIYTSMMLADLSTIRSNEATANAQGITLLFHTKTPPR